MSQVSRNMISRFISVINRLRGHNESPLTLPSVWGLNSPYHPSVLFFKEKWNGYHYWMAETPFPFPPLDLYRDRYECPCIHVSNDGIHWNDIEGLTNPLIDLTDQEIANFDFFSDPHLFMCGDRMECWFRISRRHGNNSYHVNDTDTFLLRMISTDGKHWSKAETLLNLSQISSVELVSPAIIYKDGKYQIWMVEVDVASQRYSIVCLTSADTKHWSNFSKCNLEGFEFSPWHIDIQYFDNKFQLVVFELNSSKSLSLWQSVDGLNFSKIRTFPISTGFWGSFYELRLYRASLCKVSDSDYRLYFGCNDSVSSHIGLLAGKSISDMSLVSVDNKPYRSLGGFMFFMCRRIVLHIFKFLKK